MAEIIGGYRMQKLMMTGQNSQVWEVVEQSSHRHFAMKILLPENNTAEYRRLLFHEATVGKQMAHQNIIRIVTVNRDIKMPYFVMEFFPGGSLRERMMRKQFDFIKENALGIFKQWATALAFMNAQNWVHRDVKPDNILVSSAGDLRVIDFALATRIERPNFLQRLFRRKKQAMGTRSYISPEQIRGTPLDGRADVYSFGASAYEITTGRPPFRGVTAQDLLTKHIMEKPASPESLNADVTKDFADLILRMLNKKREDRPRDFHEVLMAMRTMRVFKSVEFKPSPTDQ